MDGTSSISFRVSRFFIRKILVAAAAEILRNSSSMGSKFCFLHGKVTYADGIEARASNLFDSVEI